MVRFQVCVQKESCEAGANESQLWGTCPRHSRWWILGTVKILNTGIMANSFKVVLIIRFSIIPSHFSTAVFSTCNVKFWYFAIATFLTLPKQIILVYFGVLLVQETKDNTINTIVLSITFLTTIVAGVYIYTKMRKTKKILLEEQAARLEPKQDLDADFSPEIHPQEDFWQPQSSSGNANFRPAPPARWQEGIYEMEDTRRPNAKPAEFI